MIQATLQRTYSGTDATLGILTASDGSKSISLCVIERPWLNNAANKSCIPAGIYRVVWSKSPRLRKFTYEIVGVTGRAGIRIHAGNVAADSLGCPLLGMRFGAIGKNRAVLASREAVQKFDRFFNGTTFSLEVKDV